MVLSEQCARPATSTRCLDTTAIGRSRTGEPVANVPAPLRDSQLPFSLLEGMHAREQVLWLHDPKYPARTRNPAPLGHSQGNSTVTMMQLRFRAVIALMLAVAGLAQGADPKWVKLRSANFELFTSAGERAGRRTIQQFELTRSFFQQAMRRGVSSTRRVRIVLFRSKKEYLPYRPGEVAAAYYLSGPDVDLIVMVAGNELSTAIHEYVHLLVSRSGLRLPLWLNEGLAEIYSSMQRAGGQFVVGHAPPGTIAMLREERWAPLEQVLLADRDSHHYTQKERAGKFYAQSWALTHMLNLSKEYRSGLAELLKLLTADTPSVTALETVYGMPIENLQRELQSYVRQDRLRGLVFDVKLEKSAERPSAKPATGLEVGLLLANLLADVKKTDEARTKYEKVASENPAAPGPYEGLGHLEYRLGNKDQARIHFGRAFELGSNSRRMLERYAWLQREADDEKLVLTLLRAVKTSPEDVDARLALGNHLIQGASYMQAVAILEKVRYANAEQAKRTLRMLAYAHLKLNQHESGRQAARQLLELARTPEETDYAQSLLAHLERDSADVREVTRDGSYDELGERETRLIPDETPASPLRQEDPRPQEEMSIVAGSFMRLDCLEGQARMVVAVGGETVSLLIDDGESVDLKGSDAARVDLHCGEQEPRSVIVRFLPSKNTELGTQGVVRIIEFTGAMH